MLNFIRVHAQGWVAWFIVGLISIPFALWGVNSYLTGPSDPVVATVNGENVQQAEYKQALQQYRDQMRTRLEDKFDPSVFESIEIKQAVLDGLIEKKLLKVASHDLGQRVSDARLFNEIKSTPAFQKDGQFDSNLYTRLLARSGLTPSRFESQLRGDILNQEITKSVQQSGIVGKHTFDNMQRLENQVREIAYGVIDVQQEATEIEVKEDEVRAYYDKHANQYRAPEQMVIDYIELSIEELSKDIELDDMTLQAFYNENKDQFVGPDQRQISHILIEQEEKEALETIATIKASLTSGEDFAQLASQYSQDTGSADNGGDLGLYQRENIEPTFEQAVFDQMNEGEVSEPIKSEFGYHLVKLTKIQAGEGQSFSEAKQEIETTYRRQQAEQVFYEKAEQLADLSYENPDDLSIASEELALTIKTSPSFTRGGGSGITTNKKVVTAAFSEDVLFNELNSTVIELDKSHLVVIHKNKHIAESQLPFDSVSPAIREQLRYGLAREQAEMKGKDIIAKLKAGSTLSELFDEGDWVSEQLVTRTNKQVSTQVLQKAFSTPRPDNDTHYTGFLAENGNYIVVQVSAILEGAAIPEGFPQRVVNQELQSYLRQSYKDSELQAFIASLREDAKIEIFKQFL